MEDPKGWVRYTARPDQWGVVTIPHDFWSTEPMDPATGEWRGWVKEKSCKTK